MGTKKVIDTSLVLKNKGTDQWKIKMEGDKPTLIEGLKKLFYKNNDSLFIIKQAIAEYEEEGGVKELSKHRSNQEANQFTLKFVEKVVDGQKGMEVDKCMIGHKKDICRNIASLLLNDDDLKDIFYESLRLTANPMEMVLSMLKEEEEN